MSDATEEGRPLAVGDDAAPPLRVVVGTAGHIDHGKTSLIRALTGIDCDRWAEEKQRGITIDLGFAWRREGDLQVGFVDVPGHERFLHNALAGLGGIRLALLVVAADEGVKPQTREHLDICRLLGIPRALVALTKADLVSADLVELAGLEVEELLAGTPYAGAPRHAVSATTGQGVEELAAALFAAAREAAAAEVGAEAAGERRDERPTRLPVDRAFHLKGLGVVVTGTLVSGRIRPGDTLEALPLGSTSAVERVRVRSVQVHGEPRREAAAGERTSLQLAGVPLEALERGVELVEPGRFATTRRLVVDAEWLPDAPASLAGPTAIRVHLLAAEVMGRARPLAGALPPGGRGPVELRLAAPIVAVRGDRVVLRRPSPPATLGGGAVLDPQWHRPPGRQLAAALEALAGDRRAALVGWARRAGEAGAETDGLARRLGARPEEVVAPLAAAAAAGDLVRVAAGQGHGERWLDPRAVERVEKRARRVLADYFRQDRLARGIPKAEAVRRILPGRAAELADLYLPALVARKVLAVSGDLVNLPGREAELTGEESDLARRVAERYAAGGLTPPSPGEVAHELSAKPQIVEGVVRYLVERGRLVRLPSGLIVSAAAIATLAGDLAATGWERFTVPQFKDRFGLSRKWAIPLLEHLDSTGVTRRLGDERMLVGTPER